MINTGWKRAHAGFYVKVINNVRFTVVYEPDTKLWHCRRNEEQFDAGRTLAEAKTYCVEPEGKPLIEIL